jgi:hypothetical protein
MMITHDRLYGMLLSLYPSRFRKRFGLEMILIFRDCCRLEMQHGHIASLWLQTLKDLFFSLPREWRRETAFMDSEIDYTGLVDRFMISVVVGTNLLGWGWAVAAVALKLTVPHIMEYRGTAAMVLAGVVTLAMAALIGILCSLVVGRSGRPEGTRIKV